MPFWGLIFQMPARIYVGGHLWVLRINKKNVIEIEIYKKIMCMEKTSILL